MIITLFIHLFNYIKSHIHFITVHSPLHLQCHRRHYLNFFQISKTEAPGARQSEMTQNPLQEGQQRAGQVNLNLTEAKREIIEVKNTCSTFNDVNLHDIFTFREVFFFYNCVIVFKFHVQILLDGCVTLASLTPG